MNVNETANSKWAIGRLINKLIDARGNTLSEFAIALQWKDSGDAERQVRRTLDTGRISRRLRNSLVHTFGVEPDSLNRAEEETRLERLTENFRPHIQVLHRPGGSVLSVGAVMQNTPRRIDTERVAFTSAVDEAEHVKSLIQNHYEKYSVFFGVVGGISAYEYRREPDLSWIFSPFGARLAERPEGTENAARGYLFYQQEGSSDRLPRVG